MQRLLHFKLSQISTLGIASRYNRQVKNHNNLIFISFHKQNNLSSLYE